MFWNRVRAFAELSVAVAFRVVAFENLCRAFAQWFVAFGNHFLAFENRIGVVGNRAGTSARSRGAFGRRFRVSTERHGVFEKRIREAPRSTVASGSPGLAIAPDSPEQERASSKEKDTAQVAPLRSLRTARQIVRASDDHPNEQRGLLRIEARDR